MPAFSRLVRFLAKDGLVYHGDAILPSGVSDLAKTTKARIIKGEIFGNHQVTDQVQEVKKLLCPLARKDIKTIRCLGLNYAEHAKESNMPLPKYPILFFKPVTAASGPTDDIPVHPMAQECEGLDYECELVIIIGKEAHNVPKSKALEYVLGYSVGNDVSHREWQIKRGGSQWGIGKGFDGWAPFGPGIVTSKIIPDPNALQISTKVNGKTVQNSNTKDMIFGVAETVAFLSQGTTLLPGDIIFTGTPQGVGMGRKPQVWLKDGDRVEVSLENVGSCSNKVVHVNGSSKL
ncbi:TPA_exp: Fumarylacetoacetate hydrolase family protein [Trichophyton benhamiae CBS 112371]|nr:TPA_exp: Fumarylacetoacetate hydrolase family protein [Trichophyton benhamiae CBS 112371]